MNKISNPEAVAWTIAAEGTISINLTHKKGTAYYYPNVNVYNTNREFVEKFWQLAGFYGHISRPSGYPSRPGNKTRHRWMLNKREEVKQFLTEILPYLPTKVTQAKVVIDFCETGDAEWLEVIKVLNRRGV